MCLQVLLTYMSDVHTLGSYSRWHAADRVHAYFYTTVRAVYTAYHWRVYSSIQLIVFWVGLGCGVVCIRLSWVAVMRRDRASFLRRHTAWHASLPLMALLFVAASPISPASK